MKKIAIIGVAAFAPIFASAQGLGNIETLVGSIGRIVNLLIPIVFALAMLFFFWGLAMYIFGKEHDKEQAKKTMVWGIIALFVMAAVWGLVSFISSAVGVDTEGPGFTPSSLVPRG